VSARCARRLALGAAAGCLVAAVPLRVRAQDQLLDTAYVAAESGAWGTSARAWRRVLDRNPNLALAAAMTLRGAPPDARGAIHDAFLAPPLSPGGRRTMAQLDLAWGAARDGWAALSSLPRGDSTAEAWLEFADAARADGALVVARDAYAAAVSVHPVAEVAARGAAAALAGGDPEGALVLLDRAATMHGGTDSALVASTLLPLRVRALARLGRSREAEQVLQHQAHLLSVDARPAIARDVTWGYVRRGDLAEARAAATEFGVQDDPDVKAWLALYAGDLKQAREALLHPDASSPDVLTALTLLTRTRADSSAIVGQAFLCLTRGDTAGAAQRFVTASAALRDAAPFLLATAARLHAAQHHDALAIPLWRTVVEQYADAPEAPEADLEWGRALRRGADAAGARARWEHLILTYPESALVPLARQELSATKATA
jgi:tetratricopeptide (TPR) repeat protein